VLIAFQFDTEFATPNAMGQLTLVPPMPNCPPGDPMGIPVATSIRLA